ncbi:MAG: hypothetical protein GY868_12590, partial [Deltaproteobacteria bacterium]|nr:hypothetical protein [Deltaproteobacteria bacterium]
LDAEDEQQIDAKAKLDSDDILDELGLTIDKAELDSEGVIEKSDFEDKAVLDKDGMFEEQAPDAEAPQEAADAPAAESSEPSAEEAAAPKKKNKLLQPPLVFIPAGVVAVLVFFTVGWFVMQALFSEPESEPAPPQAPVERPRPVFQEPLVVEKRIKDAITNLILEPFMIPIVNARNESCFLNIEVLLHLNVVSKKEMQALVSVIRACVYRVLSGKVREDILNSKKCTDIRTELLYELNTVLQRKIVNEISFRNVSVT